MLSHILAVSPNRLDLFRIVFPLLPNSLTSSLVPSHNTRPPWRFFRFCYSCLFYFFTRHVNDVRAVVLQTCGTKRRSPTRTCCTRWAWKSSPCARVINSGTSRTAGITGRPRCRWPTRRSPRPCPACSRLDKVACRNHNHTARYRASDSLWRMRPFVLFPKNARGLPSG